MNESIYTIYKNNCIDINSVDETSFDILKEWIKAILTNQIPIDKIGDIESPQDFLTAIYHKLKPVTRGAFEDILLEFLADMVQKSQTIWAEKTGDRLLLLLPEIFLTSNRPQVPIEYLLYYIRKKSSTKEKSELLWRFLQTLIGLNYRCEPDFWLEISQIYGDDFSNVVFAGLTITNMQSAFTWLLIPPEKPKGVNALIFRLPLLVRQHGGDEIKEHLYKLISNVTDSQRERIFNIAQKLGIILVPRVLAELPSEEIDELSAILQYPFKIDSNTNLEKVIELDKYLRENYRIGNKKYERNNPDMEIVSCLSEVFRIQHDDLVYYSISDSLRKHFIKSGEAITEKLAPEEQISFLLNIQKIIEPYDVHKGLQTVII